MGITRGEFLPILNKWAEERNAVYSNKAEIVEDENYVCVYAYEINNIYNDKHDIISQEKIYSRLICFANYVFRLAGAFGVDAYVHSQEYTRDDKRNIPFIMLSI